MQTDIRDRDCTEFVFLSKGSLSIRVIGFRVFGRMTCYADESGEQVGDISYILTVKSLNQMADDSNLLGVGDLGYLDSPKRRTLRFG